jgi:large subunit ribosomal protein L10
VPNQCAVRDARIRKLGRLNPPTSADGGPAGKNASSERSGSLNKGVNRGNLEHIVRRKTLSLNRSEKQAVIDEVSALAAKAQTLVMAEYRGITVADMTKLRVDARSKGVSLQVLKNTLARRAVSGTSFAVVADQMTGPLIYGFSEDAVAAAKVVADFAKTNDKLVIRGGAYSGKALDVNSVKQLANIPSKEVLLSQLAGLLMSPVSRTARVLAALAEKKGEAAAA